MEEENKQNQENNQNANAGTDNNGSVGAENNQNQNDNTKSFDDILKDSKYQAEFDRRVQKAIETAQNNWKQKHDEEKTEAEKLAKMSKEEKLEYQLELEKNKRIEAENKNKANDLEKQAIKIASDKGLDVSLLQYIDFTKIKAEELLTKIEEMSKTFNEAVERKVNSKYQEDTPKTGNVGKRSIKWSFRKCICECSIRKNKS